MIELGALALLLRLMNLGCEPAIARASSRPTT
jgi:hypothetical protein